jgi:hypothetical protein
MDTLFPRCMREGKKLDAGSWALADALLAETDDSSRRGIKACSADFERCLGLDLSPLRLETLRFVAAQFPKSRRYDGVHNTQIIAIEAHREAENPDNLDAIVKAAKKQDVAVTKRFCRHMTNAFRAEERRQMEDENRAARKAEAEAAAEETAAKTRERHAKSDSDREKAKREREHASERKTAAKQKVRETFTVPRGQVKPPKDDSILTMSVLVSALQVKANEAKGLARGATKELGSRAADLNDKQRNALVEVALEAAEKWREFAQLLQKGGKRGGHLSVVDSDVA